MILRTLLFGTNRFDISGVAHSTSTRDHTLVVTQATGPVSTCSASVFAHLPATLIRLELEDFQLKMFSLRRSGSGTSERLQVVRGKSKGCHHDGWAEGLATIARSRDHTQECVDLRRITLTTVVHNGYRFLSTSDGALLLTLNGQKCVWPNLQARINLHAVKMRCYGVNWPGKRYMSDYWLVVKLDRDPKLDIERISHRKQVAPYARQVRLCGPDCPFFYGTRELLVELSGLLRFGLQERRSEVVDGDTGENVMADESDQYDLQKLYMTASLCPGEVFVYRLPSFIPNALQLKSGRQTRQQDGRSSSGCVASSMRKQSDSPSPLRTGRSLAAAPLSRASAAELQAEEILKSSGEATSK